jgi:hypothetical protein
LEHAASSILNNHGAPRAAMVACFLLVDSKETIDEQQLTLFYTIAKDGADLGQIGIAFEAKIRATRIMVRSHRFNADRILEELEDVQSNKSIKSAISILGVAVRQESY